jgi:hypothetical protein
MRLASMPTTAFSSAAFSSATQWQNSEWPKITKITKNNHGKKCHGIEEFRTTVAFLFA